MVDIPGKHYVLVLNGLVHSTPTREPQAAPWSVLEGPLWVVVWPGAPSVGIWVVYIWVVAWPAAPSVRTLPKQQAEEGETQGVIFSSVHLTSKKVRCPATLGTTLPQLYTVILNFKLSVLGGELLGRTSHHWHSFDSALTRS